MFVSLAFLVPKCNAVIFKLCMLSCNPPSRVKHFTKHNFSTMYILWLNKIIFLKATTWFSVQGHVQLIQDSRTKNLRTTRGYLKVSEIGM